tara:strand:- start:2382 stop:3248 length:867 start_codon:yes stop_codon:yes gene_type:complete
MKVQVLHNPIKFSELQPSSIALDGAVRGTHFDFSSNRWSFDQHGENQHSVSTRSTCMQVLLALRAGLDVSGIENVYVSSIDADSVTATSLILNPELAGNEEVIEYVVMYLDTVDSMGPTGALQNEMMSFHYSLKAGFKDELTTELLMQKVELFMSLIQGGDLFKESPPRKNECTLVSISNDGNVIGMKQGQFSFFDLYSLSNVGILYSPEKVTLGIKSSFVTNKNMLRDGLFDLFNAAEIAKGAPINEEGELVDRWGGKDLVGGSPFGASTLLSVDEVSKIFCDWLKS